MERLEEHIWMRVVINKHIETEQHHPLETKCVHTWLCHREILNFLADSTHSFLYTHTSIILYMICIPDMRDEEGCQCNRGRLGLVGSGALLYVSD